MGRIPKKINPESKKRFKELLDRIGMNQMELSKEICISQQYLSLIATGKKNISENVADCIVIHHPDIRKEWLLGYDNYPTEIEKKQNELFGTLERASLKEKWFLYTAQMVDTIFDQTLYDPVTGSAQVSISETDEGTVFTNSDGEPCNPAIRYQLIRDDIAVELTHDELSSMQGEILRFIDFRISELFRERGQ